MFADAQQALLPASGMLAWYEPQPSSKLATVLERAGIADGGHQGRRTSGPNPRDRQQTLTLGMRRGQGCECLLVIGELLFQGPKLLHQLPKHLLAQGVSLSCSDSSLSTTACRNFATPLGITMPYSCSSPWTSLTRAVRSPLSRSRTRWRAWRSCWATSLVGTSAWSAASLLRRSLRHPAYQFLFVCTDWLHKLRRHQLHLMAVLSQAACPGMGATAGFHTNARRGELGDKGHHLRAIEPFAYQNRAVLIHPHEVKHLFCNVDADDAKLLHGTRLLVVEWFHWS